MAQALQSDDRIAHYRVIRALGAGGMGEVYLARDSTLDREVALKVLPQMAQDDDRVKRFILEAKAASSLNHPHIITIYEIGNEPLERGGVTGDRVQYMAMELVAGETLGDLIHDPAHKTDLKTLLGYLAQAADGLAKAHASGIVHRDLKPGNIMVSRDGYAKILDFGLAKLVEKESTPADATIAAATRPALTMEGMIVGTIGYMAPEQILGRPIDNRSDIFSFGCILYEAITRQRPFTANSQFEALQKIIHENPSPLEAYVADAPAELRLLVGRCLAKAPEQRVQTMKEVASELRRVSTMYDSLARSGANIDATVYYAPLPSGAIPPPTPSGPVAAYPTTAIQAPPGASTVVMAPPAKKTLPIAAIAAVGVVVLAIVGFVVWKFALGKSGGLSEEAISQMKVTPVLSSDVLQGIAVSPEGRYAAYVSLQNGKWQLQIHQINKAGKDVEIVPAQDLPITGLSFTPDGESLWYCMADKDNSQYSSLYEVPSLGGNSTRKVQDADTEPAFSPDGKMIAFVRGSPANKTAALMISPEDGSSPKVIASLPSEQDAMSKPRWSPDGKKIAIVYAPVPDKPNLVVFDAQEGSKPEQIGSWEGRVMDSVAWLGTAGFVIAGAPAPGPSQIWYVSYPGGDRRRLSNDISDYAFVSTSADGKTIAARRTQRTSQIWQVPVNGSPKDITAVTQQKENISNLFVAADGTLVYNAPQEDSMTLLAMKTGGAPSVIAPKGTTVLRHIPLKTQNATAFTAYGADLVGHIHRVDVDGSNAKQLTKGTGETLINATPDGKFLVYNTPQATRTLQVIASDGSGSPRQLATDYIDQLVFSHDGKLVSYNKLAENAGQQVQTVRAVVNFADGKPVSTLPMHPGYQFTTDDSAMTFIQPGHSKTASTPATPATVFKVPVAGGTPQKLFEMPGTRIDVVRWADDKTAVIAALSLANVVTTLSRWTMGSADPVPLTDFRSGFIFEFASSQDEKMIYFTQGSNNRDIIKITGLVK